MLQAFISFLLLDTYPASLAIPIIANGTTYIHPARITLGRYPVTVDRNPGLRQKKKSRVIYIHTKARMTTVTNYIGLENFQYKNRENIKG